MLDREARLISEGGRLVIELSSTLPGDQRRFSVAHELGHLIITARSGSGSASPGVHMAASTERLCDRLARELLAPEPAIRGYLKARRAAMVPVNQVSCSMIVQAASDFDIPVEAMAARIVHDLAIAPRTMASLWRRNSECDNPVFPRVLHLASIWHPRPDLALATRDSLKPVASVASEAFRGRSVLRAERDLLIAGAVQRFQVEATRFHWFPAFAGVPAERAVLALLTR